MLLAQAGLHMHTHIIHTHKKRKCLKKRALRVPKRKGADAQAISPVN